MLEPFGCMKVPEMGYKLPFHSTNATKLIIFHQFKLLHRRLATNGFLNKIGIREKLMIFAPFAEPKKSLVFISSGHLVRRSRFCRTL